MLFSGAVWKLTAFTERENGDAESHKTGGTCSKWLPVSVRYSLGQVCDQQAQPSSMNP